MTNEIQLPILVELGDANDNELAGGTATVGRAISSALRSRLESVTLDNSSLTSSARAAIQIAKLIEETTQTDNTLHFDSIQFQLSVSANGTVGFMGTSASMQSQTVLTIVLKTDKI